jgi:hypothetical protein
MAEKKDYKQYRGTMSYRKFQQSRICVIAVCFMYLFIELIWGLLGYFLMVPTLLFMALYGNFFLAPLVVVFTITTVTQFKKFKKKVDDGSIEDEPKFSGYIPGGGGFISPLAASTIMNTISDASLSPTEKKVKGLIQMYPKITMEELAVKAGVPGNQIEEMLLKLLSNGNIKGHVDPGTGEFISGMIDTTQVKPVDDAVFDCPHCGAVMKSAPVRGTSVKCESCGNLIVVK